jgi:hypothetical protein
MASPDKSRPNSVLSRTGDDFPPYARPWWFHSSPLALDDPLAPLPKTAVDEGTWNPFSKRDCLALEEKWDVLPDPLKRKEQGIPDENGIVDELGLCDLDVNENDNKTEEQQVEDVSQDDFKVIVGVERLHHVDLVMLRYFVFKNIAC